MSRTMVGLLVAMVVAGATGTARGQSPELVERGMAVYAEQRCGLCHSVADEGNAKGPLDGVGSRLTAEKLDLWLTDPKGMTEKTGAERRPAMREYPSLSDEDRAALVAYMLSLTDG